eukprot:COSAG02_NODE_86_length_39084_cov_17.815724_6_plen_61_part_00
MNCMNFHMLKLPIPIYSGLWVDKPVGIPSTLSSSGNRRARDASARARASLHDGAGAARSR